MPVSKTFLYYDQLHSLRDDKNRFNLLSSNLTKWSNTVADELLDYV